MPALEAHLPRYLPLLALVCIAGARMPAADNPTEYELKAAFLYKFASFVEWPGQSVGPVSICVVGEDPFGSLLERVVKDKSVNGRPFAVRRFKTLQGESPCHILFIASSEKAKLKSILEGIDGPVLTVGDTPEYCHGGVIINLQMSDDRVHLHINPESAEKARLRLSSKLLGLATIVHSPPE